jgi:hypothetical protein
MSSDVQALLAGLAANTGRRLLAVKAQGDQTEIIFDQPQGPNHGLG